MHRILLIQIITQRKRIDHSTLFFHCQVAVEKKMLEDSLKKITHRKSENQIITW